MEPITIFPICFSRLFVDAWWSPAGKGLTSWLSSVMSDCEVVTFPLVSWVRCGEHLIVSIPDICPLSYYDRKIGYFFLFFKSEKNVSHYKPNEARPPIRQCTSHLYVTPLGDIAGLSAGFWPTMCPRSGVEVPGFNFPPKYMLITKKVSLCICTSPFCQCLDSIFNTLSCQTLNLKAKTSLCSWVLQFFTENNAHLLCSCVQEYRNMYTVALFLCLRLPSEIMYETTEPTEAKFHVVPPWDRGKMERLLIWFIVIIHYWHPRGRGNLAGIFAGLLTGLWKLTS